MNQLDLKGKGAIVTGGAAGLGFGIARRLALSGARLMLWDRDGAALDRAAGELASVTEVCAAVVDVSAPSHVDAAAQAAIKHLGAVDVLVNNAGISGANAVVWEYPVDEWRRVLDVNLTGTFLCCRALVPHMAARGGGRVVNVASVAGKEGNPNAAAYSASKAGVIALTKALGKELACSGVLVNCVTPGAVRTAIFDQMTDAHVEFMLSKIPMGRFGRVEEIAALVAWLCTEDCSFSTGGVFDASGGRATY